MVDQVIDELKLGFISPWWCLINIFCTVKTSFTQVVAKYFKSNSFKQLLSLIQKKNIYRWTCAAPKYKNCATNLLFFYIIAKDERFVYVCVVQEVH